MAPHLVNIQLIENSARNHGLAGTPESAVLVYLIPANLPGQKLTKVGNDFVRHVIFIRNKKSVPDLLPQVFSYHIQEATSCHASLSRNDVERKVQAENVSLAAVLFNPEHLIIVHQALTDHSRCAN